MVSRLFPTAISKTAAARILPFALAIESLRQLSNGAIQVTYRVAGGRRCSTFLSRKAFERDFIEFRIKGAESVSVKPWGAGSYRNHFDCRTEGCDRSHTVKLLGGIALCSCEDYEKSRGNHECKHIYATLQHLGHSSMADYIESRSAQIKAEEEAAMDAIWASY